MTKIKKHIVKSCKKCIGRENKLNQKSVATFITYFRNTRQLK